MKQKTNLLKLILVFILAFAFFSCSLFNKDDAATAGNDADIEISGSIGADSISTAIPAILSDLAIPSSTAGYMKNIKNATTLTSDSIVVGALKIDAIFSMFSDISAYALSLGDISEIFVYDIIDANNREFKIAIDEGNWIVGVYHWGTKQFIAVFWGKNGEILKSGTNADLGECALNTDGTFSCANWDSLTAALSYEKVDKPVTLVSGKYKFEIKSNPKANASFLKNQNGESHGPEIGEEHEMQLFVSEFDADGTVKDAYLALYPDRTIPDSANGITCFTDDFENETHCSTYAMYTYGEGEMIVVQMEDSRVIRKGCMDQANCEENFERTIYIDNTPIATNKYHASVEETVFVVCDETDAKSALKDNFGMGSGSMTMEIHMTLINAYKEGYTFTEFINNATGQASYEITINDAPIIPFTTLHNWGSCSQTYETGFDATMLDVLLRTVCFSRAAEINNTLIEPDSRAEMDFGIVSSAEEIDLKVCGKTLSSIELEGPIFDMYAGYMLCDSGSGTPTLTKTADFTTCDGDLYYLEAEGHFHPGMDKVSETAEFEGMFMFRLYEGGCAHAAPYLKSFEQYHWEPCTMEMRFATDLEMLFHGGDPEDFWDSTHFDQNIYFHFSPEAITVTPSDVATSCDAYKDSLYLDADIQGDGNVYLRLSDVNGNFLEDYATSFYFDEIKYDSGLADDPDAAIYDVIVNLGGQECDQGFWADEAIVSISRSDCTLQAVTDMCDTMSGGGPMTCPSCGTGEWQPSDLEFEITRTFESEFVDFWFEQGACTDEELDAILGTEAKSSTFDSSVCNTSESDDGWYFGGDCPNYKAHVTTDTVSRLINISINTDITPIFFEQNFNVMDDWDTGLRADYYDDYDYNGYYWYNFQFESSGSDYHYRGYIGYYNPSNNCGIDFKFCESSGFCY